MAIFIDFVKLENCEPDHINCSMPGNFSVGEGQPSLVHYNQPTGEEGKQGQIRDVHYPEQPTFTDM